MKLKEILKFVKSRKGAYDMTDNIIGMIVAALILFSLFGTAYTQYIAANATPSMTAGHSAMLGIIMTMLIIGFILMIWRAAKSGGK